MKASLKFREEQKPLLRAKVPLNILGMPFQSGIVAGESKELTLNLCTFFESGPSIKIAYRPNDTWSPFSLVVKTGTGPFGSPLSSSLMMSAEFNLLGKAGNPNPSFMLHFKPQYGDFSAKKSLSSTGWEMNSLKVGQNGAMSPSSDDDGSIEVVDSPVVVNGGGGGGVVGGGGRFYGKKITVLPPSSVSALAGLFSGVEMAAKTKLPMRSRAVMSFRWGVRVPAEIRTAGESTGGINFKKIPFLVMNKIGIEHIDGGDLSKEKEVAKVGRPELGNADMAEACLSVKRQLENLQSENGLLKRAVDDLRHEIGAGRVMPDWNSAIRNAKADRRGNEKRTGEGGDVNEELKKALKGATGGGGV